MNDSKNSKKPNHVTWTQAIDCLLECFLIEKNNIVLYRQKNKNYSQEIGQKMWIFPILETRTK